MNFRTIVLTLGTMLLMAYDPRTGITSYKEVAPDAATVQDPASNPEPSTATSFASSSLFDPNPAPMWDAPSQWVYGSQDNGDTGRAIWYNPQTGEIVDYSAQAPDVHPRAGLDLSAFRQLQSTLGMDVAGGSRNFTMPLYAVNPRTGFPELVYTLDGPDGTQTFYFASDGSLPVGASQGLAGGYSYGNDKNTIVEPGVIAGLGAITGGMFGPALAGATGLSGGAAAGTVGGATAAGIGTGGDLEAMGQGAVLGGLGGGAAQSVSGMVGPGMLGSAAGGLTSGALTSFASGGDIVRDALLSGALAGGSRGLGELYVDGNAPTPAAPTGATSLADTSFDVGDPLKRGMLPSSGLFEPMQLASADAGVMTDVPLSDGPLMPPAVLDTGDATMMPRAIADTSTGMLPAPIPEADPTFGGELQETAPGVFAQPPMPTSPTLTPEQQREQQVQQATKVIEKIAKVGTTLAEMSGRSAPQDAPTRTRTNEDGTQEQLSDADYSQQLTQYALPPQVSQELADAGLTPGTPEYYQAVMDRLDATIQQVLGDADPDAADFADQLRAKSAEELTALERALFVRGQIGELMGSGTYIDPVTQKQEEVVAQGGTKVRPAVAAYHRGLARSADELAGMSPQEAKRYVGGMLSRDTDLYGMQARADAQAMAEALAAQGYSPEEIAEIMKRRRGGMLPMAA